MQMAKALLLVAVFLFVSLSSEGKIAYGQFCGNDCLKPLAVPDRWYDVKGDSIFENLLIAQMINGPPQIYTCQLIFSTKVVIPASEGRTSLDTGSGTVSHGQ
jgi:hypothetical protein